MKKNYGPNFRYMDFAQLFTAELFDPDEWAQLFAEAGAKYGHILVSFEMQPKFHILRR